MNVPNILYLIFKRSPQPLSPEKTVATDFGTALNEAERMRQHRSQEARELIGSRVGAAKAIFTKHTSEGLIQSKYVKKINIYIFTYIHTYIYLYIYPYIFISIYAM